MSSWFLSIRSRFLELGFHFTLFKMLWLMFSLPRPLEGSSITLAPEGYQVYTLPVPVTMKRSLLFGQNLKLFTGLEWMRTEASSRVVMSQTQTVPGIESHLVAR